MEILFYRDPDYHGLKKQTDKVIDFLRAGDFKSADVKKMPNTGYFRAKLDEKNRLLFKIGNWEGKKYLFLLEVIPNHAYDKSHFLGGGLVDESKLVPLNGAGSESQGASRVFFAPCHHSGKSKPTLIVG